MKRLGLTRIALTAVLSLVLLVACSTGAEDRKEAQPVSPAGEASDTSVDESSGADASEQKVYHRLALGETVNIHGILVTVSSADDGPESVDGKQTFAIHVKYEARPDPSYYSAEGTNFSPANWTLEYASGDISSEIATTGAAGIGDVTLLTGDEAEGDIYFVKKGDVTKVIYTPHMFDWYPEVTTWAVR